MDASSLCPACKAEIRLEDLTCRSCGVAVREQPLLGEVLIDEGIVTREKLNEAISMQKRRLGDILVEIGACKTEDLGRALKLQSMRRTRADIYRGRFQVALIGSGLMALLAVFLMLKSARTSALLERLNGEQLSLTEVAAILDDEKSPHQSQALLSLGRQLYDPAAVGLLDKALRRPQRALRFQAALLARISRSKALVDPLIELLTDSGSPGALAAHEALVAVTNEQLPPIADSWRVWATRTGASTTSRSQPDLAVSSTGPSASP